MHSTLQRPSGFALSLVALGLAAFAASSAQAQTVYSQASIYPTGSGYASQNDTSIGGTGNFATTYDNFTLSAGSPISGATWEGRHFNPIVHGAVTGFTLTFYADSGGQPGVALATDFIPGNAGETLVNPDRQIYDYSATFAAPFAATGGTPYWLSVVPDLAYPPQWSWYMGAGGDGAAYQDFKGVRSPVNSDMAFSLTDAPIPAVPEASTTVSLGLLLALGMGGMVLARKRRKA